MERRRLKKNRRRTVTMVHSRLPIASSASHSAAMTDTLQATIASILQRAPDWIRQELLSKEKATRARAEEALAAMISNALNVTDAA